MVKRSITLETIHFDKAGTATSFFRDMLHRYEIGDKVSDDDARHLRALLKRHDEEDEKIGVGLLHFEVGFPPDPYTGRCFWIIRIDGTRIDFSVPHCLKA